MTTSAAVEAQQQVDPRWGEDYGCGRVAYVTPMGEYVWMYRKGQRVRYFNIDGVQVGPEHANVMPAIVWAAAHTWIDPFNPNQSLACAIEVRGQIAGVYTEDGERIA